MLNPHKMYQHQVLQRGADIVASRKKTLQLIIYPIGATFRNPLLPRNNPLHLTDGPIGADVFRYVSVLFFVNVD